MGDWFEIDFISYKSKKNKGHILKSYKIFILKLAWKKIEKQERDRDDLTLHCSFGKRENVILHENDILLLKL